MAVQAHLPPHAQEKPSITPSHPMPVMHARKKRRIALHGRLSSGRM